MRSNNIQQGMTRCSLSGCAALIALASLSVGCEFDASGTGGGGVPVDPCTLNFDIGQTYIDLDPDAAGLQQEGDHLASEAFRLSWSYLYIGHHDWEGIFVGPYDFTTRVRIWEGEDMVFETEFDGEVSPGDFDSNQLIFDDGLPAGDYVCEIVIDTEGNVPECDGLPNALDNFREFEFSVVAPPIDDLQEAPSGSPIVPARDDTLEPAPGRED